MKQKVNKQKYNNKSVGGRWKTREGWQIKIGK